MDSAVKDLEYESVKAVFEAANDDGKNNILSLAEFQILANKATIAEADTENIVWKSTALHSNYSQDTLNRIVDGNLSNTWSADQYPAYVDFDLGAEYDLSRIEVYTPKTAIPSIRCTTATMVRITANLRKNRHRCLSGWRRGLSGRRKESKQCAYPAFLQFCKFQSRAE